MDKKVLVKDLATRVRKYQAKAKLIDVDLKNIGDSVFIQLKDETIFNPKYLKFEDFFTLKALESFLKAHKELSKEDIMLVINSDKNEFEFLQKFDAEMPTIVDDLRSSGAKILAINYINNLLYAKKEDAETLNQ